MNPCSVSVARNFWRCCRRQTARRHNRLWSASCKHCATNPLRVPDGHALSLRASAGMAEVGIAEPMADAVVRADQALYAAKAAGRDTWRWAAAAR